MSRCPFPSFSLLIFTVGSTNFYVTVIKHWSHCLDRNCQSCKFNTLKSTGIQTRVASFECDCITTWQKFRQSPSSSSPFWIFFCSIRITLKVFIFDRRHLIIIHAAKNCQPKIFFEFVSPSGAIYFDLMTFFFPPCCPFLSTRTECLRKFNSLYIGQ